MADTRITPPGATMVTAVRRFNGRTPKTLVDTELENLEPRSKEYRIGMLHLLNYRMRSIHIVVPYKPGTAAFDAYFAGNEHGHRLWHRLQAEAKSAPNAERGAYHV